MSELKRYCMETEGDMYGPIVVERHDQEFGEWCQAVDALREIATRDARIAELEVRAEKAEANYAFMAHRAADQHLDGYREIGARAAAAENAADKLRWRIAELSTALRELVEEVEDADCLHRTNCPKCDADPEELIVLCPYHKAKRLLGGDAFQEGSS